MHAEHPPVDDGRECEVVKDVSAVSPRICVAVLALALIEEPIHLRKVRRFDKGAFVIDVDACTY